MGPQLQEGTEGTEQDRHSTQHMTGAWQAQHSTHADNKSATVPDHPRLPTKRSLAVWNAACLLLWPAAVECACQGLSMWLCYCC
jgi:hypothetical protein